MGQKGDKTKQLICMSAYRLFAEKGYKDVTMKDICESTGLSRGGLYRHYASTEQIFMQIIQYFMDHQDHEFTEQIRQGIPAKVILNDVLSRYEQEMSDSEHSLSIAIYEYFSNPETARSNHSILYQYQTSRRMWLDLIEYGIKTGEFNKTDPAAVYDIIVFSYQGVRMYSKLMKIDGEIPHRIMEQIKYLLLREE